MDELRTCGVKGCVSVHVCVCVCMCVCELANQSMRSSMDERSTCGMNVCVCVCEFILVHQASMKQMKQHAGPVAVVVQQQSKTSKQQRATHCVSITL